MLPTVLSLSDEDVLRIADFAKAGGTVIVGYAAGLIDEHFHIGLGGYPGAGNGLLSDMLGIRSEEFNILGEEAEGEPSEISLSNGLTTRLWQNDVTSVAADTTVLASYAGKSAADWELERTPAITSRPYGNGTAIYVGCDLNRHDIAQLLRQHLAPDGRSCRRSRLRVVKLQPIPPQIPASCTPSANPQTVPSASISI